MLSGLVAPSFQGTQSPLQTLIGSHSTPGREVSVPLHLVYYYPHFVILPKFFYLLPSVLSDGIHLESTGAGQLRPW